MKIKTFEKFAARFRESEQTKETRTTKQNKQTKEIRKNVWFLLPRGGLRILYIIIYIYLVAQRLSASGWRKSGSGLLTPLAGRKIGNSEGSSNVFVRKDVIKRKIFGFPS